MTHVVAPGNPNTIKGRVLAMEAKLRWLEEKVKMRQAQLRDLNTDVDDEINALPLTAKKKRLLHALLSKNGKATPPGQLAVAITDYGEKIPTQDVIRVHVCAMRKALAGSGITIRTHWGGGYSAIREPAHDPA
jgi:DNA-binding response OmpR family regulator